MPWNASYSIRSLIFVSVIIGTSGVAQSASSDEDFFSEIESDSATEDAVVKGETTSSSVNGGFIRSRATWAVREPRSSSSTRKGRGLSQLETVLYAYVESNPTPAISFKLSGELRGDAKSNSADKFDLKDSFFDIALGESVRFKTGRQVIVWGESNYFQVVDQINPRDSRELGYGELEDARLPVFASRLSYVDARMGVDLTLIHEDRSNRTAAQGEVFDLYQGLRSNFTIEEDRNSNIELLNKSEWMFRLFKSFRNTDVSLIAGRVHSDSAVLQSTDVPTVLSASFPLMDVYGVSFNKVMGSMLLRGEYGRLQGEQLAIVGPLGLTRDTDTNNFVLGMDFALKQNVALTLEWLLQHVDSGAEEFKLPRKRSTVVADLGIDVLKDTGRISLQWRRSLQGDSDVLSLKARYNVNDKLTLSLGVVDYFSPEPGSLLEAFNDEGRVYMDARYNF